MKRRLGFVSNSSSSSFTCDVCGHSEEVYDGENDTFLMCEEGHTICKSHMKNFKFDWEKVRQRLIKDGDVPENEIEMVKTMTLYDFEGYYNDEYGDPLEVPKENCPICNMSILGIDDFISYILKINSTSRETVAKAVKERFGSYPEFKKWLKEKK